MIVSVSLRSIIHSYTNLDYSLILGVSFKVSVSLRSIIHSYPIKVVSVENIVLCFRLLTEYYSFLFKQVLGL